MPFALTTNEIKVTDAARDYLAGVVGARGGDLAGVRLSILSGKGCGGNEYDLQVVDAKPEGDEVLSVTEGLRIYIPAKDTLKLFGTTIDYRADGVGNARIIIENPNETGRCGCGESVVF